MHFSRTTLQIPRHLSPFINKLRGNQTIAWIYVYDHSPDGKEKIEKSSWEGIDRIPSFRRPKNPVEPQISLGWVIDGSSLTAESSNISPDSLGLRHKAKNCEAHQRCDDNKQQWNDDVIQHDDLV
jgi:hypothetical protein